MTRADILISNKRDGKNKEAAIMVAITTNDKTMWKSSLYKM